MYDVCVCVYVGGEAGTENKCSTTEKTCTANIAFRVRMFY